MNDSPRGALPHPYWLIKSTQAEYIDGGVIEEAMLSIYVNGQDLATLMCSPLDEEDLALGFLYNEGIISALDEIGLIQANRSRSTIDIFLTRADFSPPRRMILTSGCGVGVTWQDLSTTYAALESTLETTPEVIHARMRDLNSAAHLYQQVRGVHTAILATQTDLLCSAEDIGRHNTIDKLAGKALQAGIRTHDCLILSSGRISSEMLNKARYMGVPIIASRTAPTSTAVKLAQAWNICILGYVRYDSLRIYTHPQRLGLPNS